MKRKIIPVLVALLLIVIVGGVAVGSFLLEKYSYGKEEADLDAYYQVSGEQLAIILQDEMVEEKAILRNGLCYFDLDTVHRYFNEVFYVDIPENILLYTSAVDTTRAELGGTVCTDQTGSQELGYVAAFVENDAVYVAADYVKRFTNYSVELFDRHVQVYTQWGEKTCAEIKKATDIRERGGVKSPILRRLEAGETVEVLEQMETWSKVKTSDSIIGYVENKRLTNESMVTETPVTDYAAPEYTTALMEGKISLGFHSIGGPAGNSTLDSMAAEAKGMNVIAPTWISMNDNMGGIRNFGTADYVNRAHELGLQVWGVADNFNYRNETGTDIDTHAVLSATTSRLQLVQNIVNAALSLGLDGINVDFEQVEDRTGVHYVQFLRELSVQCRSNALVLSIDNYVPFHFNDHYRLDIQGEIADYLIIMGYDEHYHNSGDPGSVASIDYVTNGLEKTIASVPEEKVINALPFYTIVWKTDNGVVSDEYLTMNNTASFLSQVGAETVWDEETCQNYAEWTSGSATYQIWLEDAESISVKLNVMGSHNLGGVAVWRLGYGTEAAWELLNAYVSS